MVGDAVSERDGDTKTTAWGIDRRRGLAAGTKCLGEDAAQTQLATIRRPLKPHGLQVEAEHARNFAGSRRVPPRDREKEKDFFRRYLPLQLQHL